MKILVLYQFANHNSTIDGLCNNLNKRSFSASSFNTATWRIKKGPGIRIPFIVRLLSLPAQIPGIRGLISKWFRTDMVVRLSKDYQVVDIHFFDPLYDNMIRKLSELNKKIKVTVWGSDFYRVSPGRHEEQRPLYKRVDIIQIETGQIADDFLKVFPEFSTKIRLAHFGLFQFDVIDELIGKAVPASYRKKLRIPEDRIVITCGTNRSEGHRHSLLLDAIGILPHEIRERLFLILPMTYGGEKNYIEPVKRKADSLNIPYILFPSFITKKENGILRIVSDILVTIQVTDALSSTIQEYMYSGNVMIAGDWLPYSIMDDNDVFYIKTTLENLSQTIENAVLNIESYKQSCRDNRSKLARLSSWEEEIKEWTAIYGEMNSLK